MYAVWVEESLTQVSVFKHPVNVGQQASSLHTYWPYF